MTAIWSATLRRLLGERNADRRPAAGATTSIRRSAGTSRFRASKTAQSRQARVVATMSMLPAPSSAARTAGGSPWTTTGTDRPPVSSACRSAPANSASSSPGCATMTTRAPLGAERRIRPASASAAGRPVGASSRVVAAAK